MTEPNLTSPSQQEMTEFQNVLLELGRLSEEDTKLVIRAKKTIQMIDEYESDGNKWTRFKNTCEFMADYSLKKMKAQRAKLELLLAKIDGSHWGVGGAKISLMNYPELKKYAGEVNMPKPWPRSKLGMVNALEKFIAETTESVEEE